MRVSNKRTDIYNVKERGEKILKVEVIILKGGKRIFKEDYKEENIFKK